MQCVISLFGHCTELMIGPGGMNDAEMSSWMCIGDGVGSTLVDDGYPAYRNEFILPDLTEEHSLYRSPVERYLGRVKVLWRMVGHVWTKYNKAYFDLVIRAAFILTNMKVMERNGINNV